MPSSASILCIGDLVIDICASPLTRFPGPGELALTERMAIFPGGNALNTAVALTRLGEKVAMAGSVGDDAQGRLLLDQLRAQGMDVRGIHAEPGGTTASTFLFRVEGEDRRFIHTLGVAATFTGEEVSPDLIPSRGTFFVAGYLKLAAWNDEALAELLRCARRHDCRVILNVCVPKDSGIDPRRVLKLLEYVDLFVLNEDEARIISGQDAPPIQALTLRQAGAGAAIITRGAKGLYADDGQQSVQMGVYSVPLVDPSGCGDCFSAGLVAALQQGWGLVKALEFGSAVGALGATALGCTEGVPSFAEVERFIDENRIAISFHHSGTD